MRARLFVATAFFLALGSSRWAAAQTPPDPVAALEKEIETSAAMLASASCPTACAALGSMRRAADRLCAIDPGPRCDSARARVKDASRKVEASCPECAATHGEEKPAPENLDKQKEKADTDRGPASPPPPAPPPAAESMALAPGRGGCAGCVIGGEEQPATPRGIAAAVALALVLARARRKSRRSV